MPKLVTRLRQHAAAIPTKAKVSGLAWKRLYNVGKGFWTDRNLRWINLAHLVGILLLLYANARINVFISETLKHYMNAISAFDHATQMEQLRFFLFALAAITPVQVANNLLQTWLGCNWRNWLTNNLFSGYFANFAWDKLQLKKEIDNPDQRMTDNVAAFCGFSVTLFMSLVDSMVNIYLWSNVLWQISHSLTWTVVFWAVFGSVVVIIIGKALVHLSNTLSENEANLRFTLQEARREADAIALYNGEEMARQQASGKLKAVTDNIVSMAFRYCYLQLFTTPFNGMVPWLAPFFIAPLFASGTVEFGVIAQASVAVVALYGALNVVVNQFGGIAGYAALINRLGSLQEAMVAYANEGKEPAEGLIQVTEGADIVFDNLTVNSDDGTPLVQALNLVLKKGESLCLVGRSSVSTQIVRTLGRIWTAGAGKLQIPAREEIMFLTQMPYLPAMTLRQAIGYPCGTCGDDDQVLKVLTLAELDHLVKKAGGLDVVQSWNSLLTLSERQRLSLARIMFKHPEYAVVEEATSVLEPDAERMFYALLANSGTTIVSAVSKPDLVKFHKWVLTLPGDGTWKLQKASEYMPLASAGGVPVESAQRAVAESEAASVFASRTDNTGPFNWWHAIVASWKKWMPVRKPSV